MSYRIIHQSNLSADHFSGLKPGLSVLARVNCASGVTPQEPALEQVTPYGHMKTTLIAYHDGSGERMAVLDDFDASVIVRVDARYGDENTSTVIERYLSLLGRLLTALPDNDDEIIAVLQEASE